jgi:hypothetical protein
LKEAMQKKRDEKDKIYRKEIADLEDLEKLYAEDSTIAKVIMMN